MVYVLVYEDCVVDVYDDGGGLLYDEVVGVGDVWVVEECVDCYCV